MTDIVEWLRWQAGLDERYDEAADEIERLRKALRCAGECHAGRWYASDHENYEFYVEQFIDRMMRGDHE